MNAYQVINYDTIQASVNLLLISIIAVNLVTIARHLKRIFRGG